MNQDEEPAAIPIPFKNLPTRNIDPYGPTRQEESPAAFSIPFTRLPEGLYIHGPHVGKDRVDDQHVIETRRRLLGLRQNCPKCGGTNIDYLCKTWTYQVYCEDCKDATSPWLRTPGGLLGGPGKDNEPVDPISAAAPPC